MQVEKARELGLCYGIRRALDMIHAATPRYGTLQTLGPLAHNRTLLQELQTQGVMQVDSPEELAGPTVVVSAHGTAPDTMSFLRDRGFTILDTTCPNVTRVQHIAADMAREGLTIVIFGDSHHSEVRGVLGWAEGRGVATLDASVLAPLCATSKPSGLGIISQTTQRLEDYTSFVQHACAAGLADCREIRIVNTLCDATRRRQEAAAELSRTVDAMVVIGGRNSANTQRLAETCAEAVETHLVETADELDTSLLGGKRRIGLTAGASTPDSSIEQLEARILQL